ncbi:fumarylacetoacetate hydrolase family protein [Lacibacterium aquatile]|uniref:Fumarylacetoacetate hydrolase family protein n=1 Tax=Lacibacterium aquatile TaxID=1168082 RepID=A0ABW5DVY8_9PROT
MCAYVIAAPKQVTVPVAGGGEFPVRRIFCIGRNYAEHVKEMGGDPKKDAPIFFTKPADAIILDGTVMAYPQATTNLHHEIELVVAISKGGKNIATDDALAHVYGYAVGIDMTRRDLQETAKKGGKPWDMAKGFDQSAPINPIRPVELVGHPSKGAIRVAVNGVTKQQADLSDMIWSVPEIIAEISALVELKPGDLIYTGTPEGVGPVKAGERLDGEIEGLGTLSVIVE